MLKKPAFLSVFYFYFFAKNVNLCTMNKDSETQQTNPTPAQATAIDIEKLLHENKTLHQTLSELSAKKSQLERSLETALQRVQWFEEQFRLLRNRQFGKRSETCSSMQLELIFNAHEQTSSEAETPPAEDVTETITYTRSKTKKNQVG